MDIVFQALQQYIEVPPYSCKSCCFSAEKVIAKTGLPNERQLHCYINRVYYQRGEPIAISVGQEPCPSEIFIKKLLELM